LLQGRREYGRVLLLSRRECIFFSLLSAYIEIEVEFFARSTIDECITFSQTYYPKAEGATYMPGPGVILYETNTSRDCLPKLFVKRVLVIGNAFLIKLTLIDCSICSY